MKTLKFFVLLCAMVLSSNKIYGQTMPFQNNLSCDVLIGYEMWDNACRICSYGQIFIPAGQPASLSLCAGVADICIWVINVNGNLVPANHQSYNFCHVLTPYGTAGSDCSGWQCNVFGTITSPSWAIW